MYDFEDCYNCLGGGAEKRYMLKGLRNALSTVKKCNYPDFTVVCYDADTEKVAAKNYHDKYTPNEIDAMRADMQAFADANGSGCYFVLQAPFRGTQEQLAEKICKHLRGGVYRKWQSDPQPAYRKLEPYSPRELDYLNNYIVRRVYND